MPLQLRGPLVIPSGPPNSSDESGHENYKSSKCEHMLRSKCQGSEIDVNTIKELCLAGKNSKCVRRMAKKSRDERFLVAGKSLGTLVLSDNDAHEEFGASEPWYGCCALDVGTEILIRFEADSDSAPCHEVGGPLDGVGDLLRGL